MKKLLFLLLVVLISSCTVQENTQENGSQDWASDGVTLARVKETGELACFGCGNAKCVDPLLDAIEWVNETGPVHCTLDFKVTSLEPSEDEAILTDKVLCENSGGTWGANACTNTCNYKRPRDDGLVSGCGGSFTPGCDCGSNRCWNGNSCEDL